MWDARVAPCAFQVPRNCHVPARYWCPAFEGFTVMFESPPSHPKHVWLQRFGARLMQLQPNLNAVTATKHAIDTFHDAAGLEPEEAADNFAADAQRGDDEATDGH
ncbi:MAG: hypothetical protein KGK18_02260 [Burkholderiales bacterium]|nr:hypothetical protein [Burkholderiales bacterium]